MLTEGVYEALKGLLMNHDIVPGSRMNIDGLARDLEVSPTPVREALARLESEGLVRKKPLVGYTAAPLLAAEEFADMCDLRMLLEPEAARRAAGSVSDHDVAVMAETLDAMRAPASSERYESYRIFVTLDAQFHDAIAAASGNSLLREALARLNPQLHQYRLSFHLGMEQVTLREHESILLAIQRHHPERARSAMAEHLQRSRLRLEPALTHDVVATEPPTSRDS